MDIHSVVSRPGRVESAILSELGGSFSAVRRVVPPVMLRSLEGGRGEPVLLLHDRLHAATMWAPLLGPLAEKRAVFAVDLPGLGHSSSPPFSGNDPHAAVRFFVAPIAALVRDLGLERAAIVGHALGGLVALELALGGHAKPSQLVLVASMGLGPEMRFSARLACHARPEHLAAKLGDAGFSRVRAAQGVALPARSSALEAELVGTLGGKAPPARATAALVPLVGPVYERSSDLERIDAETLILWGERDPSIPTTVARAAAARIPRAKLVIEPGLGDAPHLEDAARVVPKIVSFLSRC